MPIPAFLIAAAGSTVTRTLIVRGGTAILVYVTATGVVEEIFPDQGDQIEELENAIREVGGTVVSGLGNATLEVVQGIGRAVVQGIDSAYDAIREKFIVGKEPDIIAGFTVGMLTILTGLYVWNAVKNTADTL
jgi:malate/lactate dehydrogenase